MMSSKGIVLPWTPHPFLRSLLIFPKESELILPLYVCPQSLSNAPLFATPCAVAFQASRLFITRGIICWYPPAAFLSQVACVISKRMKGDKKKERERKTPSVSDLFSRGVMAIANTSEIRKLLDLGHIVQIGSHWGKTGLIWSGGRGCLWAIALKAQNSSVPPGAVSRRCRSHLASSTPSQEPSDVGATFTSF